MTLQQQAKDGVQWMADTIEQLQKERDYLDARCAELEIEHHINIDAELLTTLAYNAKGYIDQIIDLQRRVKKLEQVCREFVKYQYPDAMCRERIKAVLNKCDEKDGE